MRYGIMVYASIGRWRGPAAEPVRGIPPARPVSTGQAAPLTSPRTAARRISAG